MSFKKSNSSSLSRIQLSCALSNSSRYKVSLSNSIAPFPHYNQLNLTSRQPLTFMYYIRVVQTTVCATDQFKLVEDTLSMLAELHRTEPKASNMAVRVTVLRLRFDISNRSKQKLVYKLLICALLHCFRVNICSFVCRL